MGTRLVLAAIALALPLGGCAETLARAAAPKVDASPAALREGNYRLDPDHAALLFEVDHLQLSKFIGRFDSVNATLSFDPAHPEDAALDATVSVESLAVAVPDFAKTLLGANWFDAARFPDAAFRSTSVRRTGEATGEVDGELTIRGVSHPETLSVTFNGGGQDLIRGGYVVGFSATTTIKRSDFGIDRFEGLVGDDVTIRFEGEFIRK
ncbi:MAG: YceI family protein [Parvularculaceae bacterium]